MRKLILSLLLLGAAAAILAQVPVSLAPVPRLQFFDSNGVPCAGCLLYTYAAGTSTPLATYIDSTGTAQNANPITLDSMGSASVWMSSACYKLVLTTTQGSQLFSVDQICGNGSTFLRLDGTNGPVTGALTFSGGVTLAAGGSFTGTIAGSPTYSGSPYFSGNPTFTGLPLFKALESSSANPAQTGSIQLATGDEVCWRNAANSADVCVSKNSNSSSGSSATTWLASTSYSLGAQVVPATPNSYYYTATVAGASAATAPTWCTTTGCTVTDGTVTWQLSGPTSGLSDQFVFPAIASASANPASTGVVNLASGDTACWRNAANSADVCLSHDGNDNLLYNGNIIASPTGSGSLVYAATTPVTVSDTSSASNLQTVTLASGSLNTVGRTLRLIIPLAAVNGTGSSATAALSATIGGQTMTFNSQTVGNGDTCSSTIELDATVTAVGTSGALQWAWAWPTNCGSLLVANSGSAGAFTLNTTGAVPIQVMVTLSTASSSLSITEPILNAWVQ